MTAKQALLTLFDFPWGMASPPPVRSLAGRASASETLLLLFLCCAFTAAPLFLLRFFVSLTFS